MTFILNHIRDFVRTYPALAVVLTVYLLVLLSPVVVTATLIYTIVLLMRHDCYPGPMLADAKQQGFKVAYFFFGPEGAPLQVQYVPRRRRRRR